MKISNSRWVLIFGDVVVLALVTLYGLQTHDLMDNVANGFMRTFIPWLVAWLAMGAFADLFQTNSKSVYVNIVRPFIGMVLVSPMAALLRGLFLGAVVIPIFVVAFGGLSAMAVAAWRAIYFRVALRRPSDG